LRFLRSNDEHERQINYRALTFAFTGTLFFLSLLACCRASGSSRLLARYSSAHDHSLEYWIDPLLVAVSMKTGARVASGNGVVRKPSLQLMSESLRGTINAIENGQVRPESAAGVQDRTRIWKKRRRVFLYPEDKTA